MKQIARTLAAIGVLGLAITVPAKLGKAVKLSKAQMASITAGSSANFPPGQFPAGNPAQAPGNSNPNEHPKK